MVALQVLFLILLFLTIDYVATWVARRRAARARGIAITAPRSADADLGSRGPAAMNHVPEDVFLGRGHVWVRPEAAGSIQVGVDRLLVALLGGLECVYAVPERSVLRRGGPLVMLRHGNRALRVRSPVDGTVLAVNEEARRDPSRVPEDPFGGGWLYRIEPMGLPATLKRMVGGRRAGGWMREEMRRLVDQVSGTRATAPHGQPALADGGEISRNILHEIDDAAWEGLVARFFGAGERQAAAAPSEREAEEDVR